MYIWCDVSQKGCLVSSKIKTKDTTKVYDENNKERNLNKNYEVKECITTIDFYKNEK